MHSSSNNNANINLFNGLVCVLMPSKLHTNINASMNTICIVTQTIYCRTMLWSIDDAKYYADIVIL